MANPAIRSAASNGSNLNAIPTDLHVSVGGVDAPVIWFNGWPYTEGPYTTEPHDSIPATFDTFIVRYAAPPCPSEVFWRFRSWSRTSPRPGPFPGLATPPMLEIK